jgi:hypothetical protein
VVGSLYFGHFGTLRSSSAIALALSDVSSFLSSFSILEECFSSFSVSSALSFSSLSASADPCSTAVIRSYLVESITPVASSESIYPVYMLMLFPGLVSFTIVSLCTAYFVLFILIRVFSFLVLLRSFFFSFTAYLVAFLVSLYFEESVLSYANFFENFAGILEFLSYSGSFLNT